MKVAQRSIPTKQDEAEGRETHRRLGSTLWIRATVQQSAGRVSASACTTKELEALDSKTENDVIWQWRESLIENVGYKI